MREHHPVVSLTSDQDCNVEIEMQNKNGRTASLEAAGAWVELEDKFSLGQ